MIRQHLFIFVIVFAISSCRYEARRHQKSKQSFIAGYEESSSFLAQPINSGSNQDNENIENIENNENNQNNEDNNINGASNQNIGSGGAGAGAVGNDDGDDDDDDDATQPVH